jgi:ABC-type molybdate transport system substrate-binding protein
MKRNLHPQASLIVARRGLRPTRLRCQVLDGAWGAKAASLFNTLRGWPRKLDSLAMDFKTEVTLASLLILAVGVSGCRPAAPAQEPVLRILCGSSMAQPIQEIGAAFARQHDAVVEYDIGGSETLLPKILAGAAADLYVCHDPFEAKVKDAQRWTGSTVVGFLEPILAVRPGNPKQIRSVEDLKRAGLKLGIGDPRYSTCGELFVQALTQRGLRDAILPQAVLQARTHAELANGLIVGPLDAVVVWNFVVALYPGKLEPIPTGIEYPEVRVTVVGITNSLNPEWRDRFLGWCERSDAKEAFRKAGYGRTSLPR